MYLKGDNLLICFQSKKKLLYLQPLRRNNNTLWCLVEKLVRLSKVWFIAGIAQLVEHDLAKVGVASPSLVSRSVKQNVLRCILSGNSSVGRARPCQGRGRESESRFPLSKNAQVVEW